MSEKMMSEQVMSEQVMQIAKEAAAFMANRDFQVENKGSVGNDVTSADKQVQKYIKDRLRRLDPSIGFIGEEEGEQDYGARRAWVVDPIDGTANFIRGLNASAISIGLIEDGEAVLGVVYNPYQDELYSAQKGKGAFLNGIPIHVSDRDFAHGMCCTAFCLYRKELSEICQRILTDVYAECEDFRRIGTASIELTALAAGKVELYFEIRLYPWDYAASACIIKEAGGHVGSISMQPGGGDAALSYTGPGPIVAANSKENYEQMLAIIKRHMYMSEPWKTE